MIDKERKKASKREINELKYYPDQKLQFIILYTLYHFSDWNDFILPLPLST
jgi:hypothetical protein